MSSILLINISWLSGWELTAVLAAVYLVGVASSWFINRWQIKQRYLDQGHEEGHAVGYSSGAKIGFAEGFDDGREVGFDDGYEAGFDLGRRSVRQGERIAERRAGFKRDVMASGFFAENVQDAAAEAMHS